MTGKGAVLSSPKGETPRARVLPSGPVDRSTAPLLGGDGLLDGTADFLAYILDAVKGAPALLCVPALVQFRQAAHIGEVSFNAKSTAKDVGHTLGVQFTFLPVIGCVVSFRVDAGMGDLCRNGGKGFAVRVVGIDIRISAL